MVSSDNGEDVIMYNRMVRAALIIDELEEMGCKPSLYERGSFWRAHVNQAGNFWADHKRPDTAIKIAKESWEKAGRPMDGLADGGS